MTVGNLSMISGRRHLFDASKLTLCKHRVMLTPNLPVEVQPSVLELIVAVGNRC